MKIEPKCSSCKKNIRNDKILYMCVDNSFCSMPCRDKHLRYIRNFDPEFNYPDRWNNNNLSTKIDCMIEVDYLYFPKIKSKHELSRSQSLTNLLEYNKREKICITCIKIYSFNIKFTNRNFKVICICGLIIFISIFIRQFVNND